MTFAELNNLHAGRPAVIIGKGPSLDAWLEAGCPQPEGAVRIGVNQVAAVVPEVTYSVSGDAQMDRPEHLALPTQWLRAVPYRTCTGKLTYGNCLPDAVIRFHCYPAVTEFSRAILKSSRDEVAALVWLHGALSSADPAVHLAWYLGCTELLLVGIDGGEGRAQVMAEHGDRSGPPCYDKIRKYVRDGAERFFPGRWQHWEPSLPTPALSAP
jgi:hypothetical protein